MKITQLNSTFIYTPLTYLLPIYLLLPRAFGLTIRLPLLLDIRGNFTALFLSGGLKLNSFYSISLLLTITLGGGRKGCVGGLIAISDVFVSIFLDPNDECRSSSDDADFLLSQLFVMALCPFGRMSRRSGGFASAVAFPFERGGLASAVAFPFARGGFLIGGFLALGSAALVSGFVNFNMYSFRVSLFLAAFFNPESNRNGIYLAMYPAVAILQPSKSSYSEFGNLEYSFLPV